ncbi:MAG TPA: hypothetical protein VFE92_15930, partial [Dermatophilaceae bacterium]|nr:hypothetical protein [Dermatophilaceae bacterium]
IKAGPVLVVDHELVTSAEATQWYEDLAAQLEEQGITGKLTAAPHTTCPGVSGCPSVPGNTRALAPGAVNLARWWRRSAMTCGGR